MPCQFKLEYVSSFEPATTLDSNSENAFGNSCHFAFFADKDLTLIDGEWLCPFHLPVTKAVGNSNIKKYQWDFMTQAYYGGLLSQYIEGLREQGKPIDLCGLVHWDRLTFAMQHQPDSSSGKTIQYINLPPIALDGASFPRGVDFRGLHFAKRVYFRNVHFGGQTDFSQSIFSDDADFSGGVFRGDANFWGASFEKNALFSGARFHQKLFFVTAEFNGDVDFSIHNVWNPFLPSHPVEESLRLGEFSNAKFLGRACFNDREFLSGPNFQQASFDTAPEFHNCKFHQSANFDGAKFTDTSSPGAAHAYRTLKLAMEKLGSREEQAMFFALEQQARAEKPTTPLYIKLFTLLYRAVSNFGQDFARPLYALAIFAVVFGAIYSVNLLFITNGRMPSLTFISNFTLEQIARPFWIWSPDYLSKVGVVTRVELSVSTLVLKVISTVHASLSLGLVTLSLLALRRRFKLD